MQNQKLQNLITIVAGAAISCFIGFYNGYPLIYPDSGAYIETGFSGSVPLDRPIFYGLFLRHISLATYPWIVILVQGFISSWILLKVLGIFVVGKKKNFLFFIVIAVLTVATGYSFTVSILIPDIFSPIALLCVIILLFHQNLSKSEVTLIAIILIFCLCTHLSNIPTIGLLLSTILIYASYRLFKKRSDTLLMKRLFIPFSSLVIALTVIPITNYLYSNEFYYSKGSHVFMINHLIENGILRQYLEDECDVKDYKICDYKDDLTWNFIWDENSALYKTGGWLKNEEEYNSILKDIYTSPIYLPSLVIKNLEYTLLQIITFDVTVSDPQLQNSAPYGQIAWRFSRSLDHYLDSRQSTATLNLYGINIIQTWVIILSFIGLILFISVPKFRSRLPPKLCGITVITLFYGLINSAVCSNLSTVDPRFQNRWIWILPFLVLILANHLFQNRNTLFNTADESK